MSDRVNVYMNFYVQDHLVGVAHLGPEDRGNYTTLLFNMWDRGGALPLDMDTLAHLCVTTRRAFCASWERIKSKFRMNADVGTFTQDRLQRELEAAQGRKRRASDRGKLGAAAKWEKDAPQDACAIPQASPKDGSSSVIRHPSGDQSQIPPTPQGVASDSQDPTGTAYPAEFELFWRATNRHGSKYKALKSWRALGKPPTSVLIAAWAKWAASPKWREDAGKFQPHVTTWLNGRMHEQEPANVGNRKDMRSAAAAYVANFETVRCEFHQDILNTDRVSFKPGRTCPECKHLAALGRRGESAPLVLGTEP